MFVPPWLLVFLLIAAALVAWVLFVKVIRPLHHVNRALRRLASGKDSGYLEPEGWFGLETGTRDLLVVDSRLGDLRAQVQAEGFGLKAILASMVEGVVITDADCTIQIANNAFVRMFDAGGQVVGRRVIEVVRQADVQSIMDKVRRERQEAAGEVVVDNLLINDSNRRVYQVSVSPMRGERDKLRGLVVVFHDISRTKQLEELRREFVANVSHELRTPLAIFHGYLETLIAHPDLPPEETKRVMGVLKRHSDRLNALVTDLLTLSRLESGRIQLDLTLVQVRPFLSRIEQDWRGQFEKKECGLEIEPLEEDFLMEVDPLRLEQVFYNLLENALKYSEQRQTVRIGVRRDTDPGWLLFYVRDNGIGIPSEKVQHIFQRFYRVDRARSRDMGGTGLGLAIVKHIIQLHGGRVGAESAVGKGTEIRFWLKSDSSNPTLPSQ